MDPFEFSCRCGARIESGSGQTYCRRCSRRYTVRMNGDIGATVSCETKSPATGSWNRVESGTSGSVMTKLGARFDRDAIKRD